MIMEKISQKMYATIRIPATIRLSILESLVVMACVFRNTAGTNKEITATIISDPFMPASETLKLWILNFKPPAKMLNPSTSSRLPMMEPVKLAFTISNSPSLTRKMAMISSAALPNVAFRKPPKRWPA
ncbi:hypothetical protein CM49_01007 [Paenibacillus sp. P1XP2]|nr:hypothetical protein CM49_01007 [Paenibacillus sp. P1XP2]